MVKPCEWCGAMNSDNVVMVNNASVVSRRPMVLCREDFANRLLLYVRELAATVSVTLDPDTGAFVVAIGSSLPPPSL